MTVNKQKKKPLSIHDKTSDRMRRETARAIAHVKMLEELYRQVSDQRRELLNEKV